MAEENQLAGNLLQTQEEKDRKDAAAGKEPQSTQPVQRPVYNPLLGMSRRQFYQALSGDNPEAPLVTTDKWGTPVFHPENVGKAGPAKIHMDQYGNMEVEGQREAMKRNIEQLSQDLLNFHQEVAPELSRDFRRSSYFNEALQAVPTFVGEVGKSMGSMIMHSVHGAMSFNRDFKEANWELLRADVKGTQEWENAKAIAQQIEESGQSIVDVDLGDIDADDKTKYILAQYKSLEESRFADERRMRVALAYDQDKTNIEKWMQRTEVLKPLGGDETSTINMISHLSGNVVGSLAVYWFGGRLLGRGAAAAVQRAKGAKDAAKTMNVVRGSRYGRNLLSYKAPTPEQITAMTQRAIGQSEAAILAANGASEAALTMAANIGEKYVFFPSFLSQYDQIRTEALLSGKSYGEAASIGFLAGMAEGGLEYAGFKWGRRFYSDGGWFKNYVLRNILPESLQEGTQTIAENIITEGFGVSNKQWEDIMSEVGLSMVAGAIGGGAFSFWRAKHIGLEAWGEEISQRWKDKIAGMSKQDLTQAVDAVNEMYDAIEAQESTFQGDEMALFNEQQNVEVEKLDDRTKNALQKYRFLTQQQKTAGKEYAKAYDLLKKHYEKRVKEKNPKATKAQIFNGWKAIRLMAVMQRDSNELVRTYNDSINRLIGYLNPESEVVKQNTAKVQELLMDKGYTEEQAKALTSSDAMEQNEAQWKEADRFIMDQARAAGIGEAEGKLMTRFIRALAYDATLVNQQVTPLEIVQSMGMNFTNLQVGILHNQELPGFWRPITKDIKFGRFSSMSPEQKHETASNISQTIMADKIDEAMIRQVNQTLYGDNDKDPSLEKTIGTIRNQGELIGQVLKHMPVEVEHLGQTDFQSMFLMHEMGMSWDEIMDEFHVSKNTDEDLEEVFEKVANDYFPKLSDEQIMALGKMADNLENPILEYPETTLQRFQEGTGFYEADENTMVLINPRLGTAAHEFGHFSMTSMLTRGLMLRENGLLSDTSPISRMFAYIKNSMEINGIDITETEIQETLLDALNDVIATGQTSDLVLTGLFSEMRAQHFQRYANLANSRYSKGKDNSLSDGQRQKVKGVAQAILEDITPATMLREAYKLREESSFRTLPFKLQEASDVVSSWKERIDKFIKSYPGISDINNILLQEAANRNDIVAMAQVANQVATEAIGFATDAFIEGKQISQDDLSLGLMKNNIFLESDTKGEQQDYVSTFGKDKPLLSQLKDVNWKGSWGLLQSNMKRYLQSLEGAAGSVSDELRGIIMKEFYKYGNSVQKFRETFKPCADAIDKHMNKKRSEHEYQLEAKDWQQHFHLVLRNGEKGAYMKAADFLEKKLGKEARKSFLDSIGLLQDVTYQMIQAGVDAKLFAWEGDFFPFAVKDFQGLTKNYYNHSHTYSINEKERARIIEDYKKKHPQATEDDLRNLEIVLIDNQNSLMQRNMNEEQRVTSFLKRRITEVTDPAIMEYYMDPRDCFDKYMESAYRTIMMRNLIGKTVYDSEGNAILSTTADRTQSGQVGAYLAHLPEGAVPQDVLDNFLEKMRFLAQRDSGARNDLFDILRQVNQMTTLGSVFNAMNQVLDLEFCYTLYGTEATNKAIAQVMSSKGKRITLEDVGALTANEAFRVQEEDVLKKATKWVFKNTGFEWTDRKVKEVILNATANYAKQVLSDTVDPNVKMTKSLAKERQQVQYIIDQCFPPANQMMFSQFATDAEIAAKKAEREEQRNRVIESLRNGGIGKDGRWDPDAKYVYWYMLTKLQPINAATIPANYNRMGPIGKMMYQFSTVAIRQLEFLGEYWKMQDKIGGSKIKAAAGMLKFMMFAAAIGIPNDAIQDILKGKTPDVASSMVFSPLHCMMINEYTISVIKNEGIFSGLTEMARPSMGVIDNFSRDAFRLFEGKEFKGYSFKSVPIVGMHLWTLFYGGHDQAVKTGRDLFGEKQNPVKAREVKEARRNAEQSLSFMEEF